MVHGLGFVACKHRAARRIRGGIAQYLHGSLWLLVHRRDLVM